MAEKTFFVSTPPGTPSAAAANKHHLTLWNGSTDKIIKVYKVAATGAPTAAVTGLIVFLSAHRLFTAAPVGGTALTIRAAGTTAGVADVLPAGIAAVTGPTVVAANEDVASFGVGTVSGEETAAPYTPLLYDWAGDWVTKPIEIPIGQGMTVKQGALASAGAVAVRLVFSVV